MQRVSLRPRKLCAGAAPASEADLLLENKPRLLVVLAALQLHLLGRAESLAGSCADVAVKVGCPAQLVPLMADVLGAKAITCVLEA